MNLFSKLILISFIYFLIYFFIFAFSYPIPDGDSLNYHIPIAKSFLNGTFINPNNFEGAKYLKFFPGASEGILALLLFFKVPIQLFNFLGVLFVFFMSYLLAKNLKFSYSYASVFAVSVSSFPIMFRWINMQIIDIWLLGFFVFTLYLLEKSVFSNKNVLLFGISSGMLIGSKLTGPIYLLVLLFLNFNKKIINFNIKKIIFFIIPFSLLGIFWYLRNYLIFKNPFYPQPFLFFNGEYGLRIQVWDVSFNSISGLKDFLNAGFGEFGIWIFSLFFGFYILLRYLLRKSNTKSIKYLLLGIICFIIFLFLPSDYHYHIIVSVFRYSLPAFFGFVLSLFIFAKENKKEKIIYLMTFLNLLIVPVFEYHPKIIFFLIPFALYILFVIPSEEIANKLK